MKSIDDYKDNCPKCSTPWTKTPRMVCNEVWTHCEPCGKKAEEIIKEMKKDLDESKNKPDWMMNNGYYATDKITIGGDTYTKEEIDEWGWVK